VAVYPDEPDEGRRNSGSHTCTAGIEMSFQQPLKHHRALHLVKLLHCGG